MCSSKPRLNLCFARIYLLNVLTVPFLLPSTAQVPSNERQKNILHFLKPSLLTDASPPPSTPSVCARVCRDTFQRQRLALATVNQDGRILCEKGRQEEEEEGVQGVVSSRHCCWCPGSCSEKGSRTSTCKIS